MAKDFYATLGVEKTATADEIKKAFRKKAHEHHPDKGGDAEKFKEINEAYQVLSDETKRAQYDRYGSAFDANGARGGFGGFQAGNFSDFASAFGDMGDLFGGFGFGGNHAPRRARGADVLVDVELSLHDAAFGCERDIALHKQEPCAECGATGAERGTSTKTCGVCKGEGRIARVQQTFLGAMQTVSACDACQATGTVPERACSACRGTGSVRKTVSYTIKIPAGIDEGEQIRLRAKGEMGSRGSEPGDLYVRVHIKHHPVLKRNGLDIASTAVIPFVIAALGGDVEVETLDGEARVKIPAGTQSGQVIRLKEKGVMQPAGARRGDHYLEIRIDVPKKVSRKAKKLLEELREELN